MKVVFATPTVERPATPYLEAMEGSVPLLDKAGIEHSIVFEVGNPYISCARAEMLRKALDTKPDAVVFIDHDMSWDAKDLVTLVQTKGDVVAGTYRFKTENVEYMGKHFCDASGRPVVRPDGCIKMSCVPAGFLKVTADAIDRFMTAYPSLCYGKKWHPYVDLFNHGAFGGLWFGEDYAFCRNWNDLGGEIWCVPNMNLVHHSKEASFPGNYHEYLLAMPGGSKDPNRKAA